MSWNLQRTINNLEYLLNQRTQYMDADNNGTIFEKNITANKFIKTGGKQFRISYERWFNILRK